MCGIGGVALVSNSDIDIPRVLGLMIAKQTHRGPDGKGLWWDESLKIGLCHTRLAILDLTEAGQQPMSSQDGRFMIAYNGEIYNWRELRETLELHGVRFYTKTDTEVLIEAYRWFKREVVHYLRGMFAFVIFDRHEKEVFAARDRVGKKRSTITNYLRLLRLDPIIQTGIRDGFTTMGHGRALVNIEKKGDQIALYERIVGENLSVRETERAVKAYREKSSPAKSVKSTTKSPIFATTAEGELIEHLSTKVTVQATEKGKGKITIPFYTKEDFNRIKKLIISG